jgi:hypothetical protein
MIATFVILAVSAALFVYWFRYSCALILSTKTTLNYSLDIAERHGLSFLAVQDSLATAPHESMPAFAKSLSNDFEVVSSMLKASAGQSEESNEAACSLLLVHFHCMSILFRLAGKTSSRLARLAVSEMSLIVEHHANLAGEQMLAANVRG